MHVPFLFALVVLVTAASPPDTRSIAQHLHRRQVNIGSVSSAPSQCASSCSPVNNEVNLGCPVTACCTTTFETQYYNCLVCVGSAVDAGNYTTLQGSLNLLYMTCVDMGFVLPRMALPGQSASNSTGSAQPSPTSSSSTGAAISARAVQVEAWIGVSLLLWLSALW